MKTFYKKEQALEAKKENEIVFTQEVKGKPKSTYRFHTSTFDNLLFTFIKGKRAYHFHEYIYENDPVKLYLDYEKKLNSEDEHLKCEEELQDILSRIRTCLLKLSPNEPEYTILDAKDSTKKKFSVHVVYHNVWCQNMNAVAQFLKKLDLDDVLDTAIYSSETGKTFRFPFAEKLDGGRPMIPRGCPPFFNAKSLCECLVSITKRHSTGKYKHLLADDPPETFLLEVDESYNSSSVGSSANKRLHLYPLTEKETYMKEVLEKVKTWLHNFRAGVVFRWETYDDKCASLYLGNALFCEHTGRVHKSNNMIMKISLVGRHGIKTSLSCMDEKCQHTSQQWNVDLSKVCCLNNFKV